MNREADLESRLGDAHQRIGALDMTLQLIEARNEFLEGEVLRLRTAILADLSVFENATSGDDLQSIVDVAIDRLGDALYPVSKTAARAA